MTQSKDADRRQILNSGLMMGAVPLIGAVLPQLARGQNAGQSSGQATSQSGPSSSVSSATASASSASSSSDSSSVASASASADSGSVAVYQKDEIVSAGTNFLGVTAEALGAAIEHIFSDNGDKPVAYIAGTETSGSIGVGVRYGKGNLYMKSQADPTYVYWQGPSVGFDTGGNYSRVFTLVYNLTEPQLIFRRFPGVEGSAYFIGGLGITYQSAEGINLAPVRAGVGFRLGANVGYLSYTKTRHFIPL